MTQSLYEYYRDQYIRGDDKALAAMLLNVTDEEPLPPLAQPAPSRPHGIPWRGGYSWAAGLIPVIMIPTMIAVTVGLWQAFVAFAALSFAVMVCWELGHWNSQA